MPGMRSGLRLDDPTVAAAFRSALVHQGLIALLIFASLGLVWMSVRVYPRRPSLEAGPVAGAASAALPEPAWRQVLRVGFGLLWLIDGILQAQPQMVLGLPSQVIEPTAASSPHWVQQLVNWAGTTWSYHPVQAAAATVWIQVGIGIWLLAASRGPLSRLAGLAGAGWGLVVWVFGESFGGIFAPGLTWLFGAPGAVLIYAAAGLLIGLPERFWRASRLLGRLVLAGTGVFLAGMAVLQAWPGRGFWLGTTHGRPGTLAGMTQAMAPIPQPYALSAAVTAFTGFDEAHGFAVNLVVVVALAAIGAVFAAGRPRLIRPALAGLTVLCLADWALVEDFGIFGGLGTDPNSMIPFALIAVAGYLALARAPAPALIAEPAGPEPSPASWRDRLRIASVARSIASASIGSVASAWAIGLIIFGAVPMAAAQASPVADTILARAINGASALVNRPAPPFSLTDQHGRQVTMASLRGKVVLLTFLDDTCSVDCPLIAQEFRLAGQLLGADSRRVELVAINYNPLYNQVSYIRAFDRQEGLNGIPDWLYLTGSRAQLQQVCKRYGVTVQVLPAGSMIGHGDYAFVIDQAGHLRQEMGFDTGPGTQATRSSFAAELASAARQLLRQP